jgi:hypothetical protein
MWEATTHVLLREGARGVAEGIRDTSPLDKVYSLHTGVSWMRARGFTGIRPLADRRTALHGARVQAGRKKLAPAEPPRTCCSVPMEKGVFA